MYLTDVIYHCKQLVLSGYNTSEKHFNIDETRFIILFVDSDGDYRRINCHESVFIKVYNRYKSNRRNSNFDVLLQFNGREMKRVYYNLPYVECQDMHYKFYITDYLPFIKYLTK